MMADQQRKVRADKDKPRVKTVRQPKRITLYLAGHGTEAKIATAIEKDVALKAKADPTANEQDVLKDWLSDYLGFKGE